MKSPPASDEHRRTGGAIDRHLDVYDVRSSHAIDVDAPVPATYRAVRDLDLGKSVPIMALLVVRGLPHFVTGKARPSRSVTLETLLQLGFTILEEDPPHDVVMGAVGKFWRPDSGLVRVSVEEFEAFDEPGYAKAALSFTVQERGSGSLLATETRVACTSDSARRKFTLYWRVIGPFSGFIRRVMLDEIKRSAEKGSRSVVRLTG